MFTLSVNQTLTEMEYRERKRKKDEIYINYRTGKIWSSFGL